MPEPRYFCESCAVEVEETTTAYECGECGGEFTYAENESNRCPDCNKFAAKQDGVWCPDCGEEIESEITPLGVKATA